MIDIHCHILPGVDDGAQSWEMAAEMCRMAAQDGVTDLVATPHANEEFAYDRPRLRELLKRLESLSGGKPRLRLGCDFHLSYENIQSALARPQEFSIEGTRYLLVEFSDFAMPARFADALEKLRQTGLTPILTHPERHPALQRKPDEVLPLVEAGCVVQVTANSLTGFWGEAARKAAVWLLEREAVHVLASDGHDPKHRPPLLSPGRTAVEELCGAKVAQALVDENPRAILAGQPLPKLPARASR
ncbi:MAG: tyrosine-protein phosphatase [Terriglobales bacterium]